MTSYRKYLAEFLGTAILILVVVGSGIMGESLSAGNKAVALLANAIATGAGLFVLIHVFGPISGAHFNPVVSLFSCSQSQIKKQECGMYILVQILGGIFGVMLTHYIFELPLLQSSVHARDGLPQMASEAVATIGLLLTICGFGQSRADLTPMGVALYITGAYWFTSSTSFANPAVTIARTFTDTFAGIAPHSAPGYIAAQVVGLFAFVFLWRLLRAPAKMP